MSYAAPAIPDPLSAGAVGAVERSARGRRSRAGFAARGDGAVQRGIITLSAALLCLFVLAPTLALVWRSLTGEDGSWAGLRNFARYFATPRLVESLVNTAVVAATSSTAAVTIAFVYAYALTHSRMHGRRLFRVVALLPLYAPTMLFAIGLVYLFGNQGLLTHGLFGRLPFGVRFELYGRIGIILAETLAIFPAALLVLLASLSGVDGRLYEAAASMGASKLRTLLTVTLPACRFGLVSAASVAVILAVTDFGAPKIVGGRTSVLAVDVYQQVVGQHDLSMGAAVSVVLLAPTALAFAADRIVRRRQAAMLTSRAAPFLPRADRTRDGLLLAFCAAVALAVLVVVLTPAAVALVNHWPYSLTGEAGGSVWSFRHFSFGEAGAYWNSLRMAAYTAVAGTIVTFVAAYAFEKLRPMAGARRLGYFLAVMPLGLPGLSLGVAYVLLFSRSEVAGLPNPAARLYGTMALLVACNVAHFFGVGFLTLTTALRQLDPEFEHVGATLGTSAWRLCAAVTVPVCSPALIEVAAYYFVSAMTTVSAVIFLYPGNLPLASVSVVHLEDAGMTQSAAALGAVVLFTNLAARLVFDVSTSWLNRRTQRWRGVD